MLAIVLAAIALIIFVVSYSLVKVWGAPIALGDFVNAVAESLAAQAVYLVAGGVLFEIFQQRQRCRDKIREFRDRIRLLCRLEGDVAKKELLDVIRSIESLSKTERIDFSGLCISDISFVDCGVKSLKYTSWAGTPATPTRLSNVSFDFVDCKGAVFSFVNGSVPIFLGEDMSFVGADLGDACFDGGKLIWTHVPNYQSGDGAFFGADLDGARFNKAYFHQADFRGSKNFLTASFDGSVFERCYLPQGVVASDLTKRGAVVRGSPLEMPTA